MPDITQIQVGTTTYDLKDEIARRNATSTIAGLIIDAPSDNKEYSRKNGDWIEISSGSNIIISVSNETLNFTF